MSRDLLLMNELAGMFSQIRNDLHYMLMAGTTGSGGGSGGGYPIGQIPQKKVAGDTTESDYTSGSITSLLDNLNNIRYWERPARWFEPSVSGGFLNVLPGIWWTDTGAYINYSGGSTPAVDGNAYLDTSSIIHIDAAYPTSGTYLPVCTISSGSVVVDNRKFFNEGGGGTGTGISGTPLYFTSNIQGGAIYQMVLTPDSVGDSMTTEFTDSGETVLWEFEPYVGDLNFMNSGFWTASLYLSGTVAEEHNVSDVFVRVSWDGGYSDSTSSYIVAGHPIMSIATFVGPIPDPVVFSAPNTLNVKVIGRLATPTYTGRVTIYTEGSTRSRFDPPPGGSSSGGHVIQSEGTNLAQRGFLDFTGNGVSVVDNSSGSTTVVSIPGMVFNAPSALTIASGAVTVTDNYHLLTSESGVSDNLDQINGGIPRQLLLLRATDGHTITLRNAIGNIQLSGGDFTSSGSRCAFLYNDGVNWVDVVPSTGSGGSGHVIQDNGSSLAQRVNLNFLNATVTDDPGGNATTVSFSSGSAIEGSSSMWVPQAKPTSPNSKDDEFDNSSFDTGKWTEMDISNLMSITEDQVGLKLHSTSYGEISTITQPVPVGAYTVWTKISVYGGFYDGWGRAGLVFQEGNETNRFYVVGAQIAGANDHGDMTMNAQVWTDYNSWDYTGSWEKYYPMSVWVRVRVNSFVYETDLSLDGLSWQKVGSDTLAFTPTKVGLYVLQSDQDHTGLFSFFRVTDSIDVNQTMRGNRVKLFNL